MRSEAEIRAALEVVDAQLRAELQRTIGVAEGPQQAIAETLRWILGAALMTPAWMARRANGEAAAGALCRLRPRLGRKLLRPHNVTRR